MKPKNNSGRRDYRNYRRRNNSSKGNEPPKKSGFLCEICSIDIPDISSAIAMPGTGNPAHFDCVLKTIAARENIPEGEKLIYLGSGSFGIVKIEEKSANNTFTIIKKIDFEEKDKTPEWRKQLGVKINIMDK